MNREIKIRAWDVYNQRMVYEPYLFENKPDYLDNPEPYRFYETWQDVEDGIGRLCYIMQFTGLKDKNGKEIYEGDIYLSFGGLKNIVEFNDGAFGYWVYPDKSYKYFITFSENKHFEINNGVSNKIEVIGNIYENSNLLING